MPVALYLEKVYYLIIKIQCIVMKGIGMKKRIVLALLILLLATPIAYASYIYFHPLESDFRTYPTLGKGDFRYSHPSGYDYRHNYRPYPAPRSERAVDYYYNVETKRYVKSVGDEFKNSARKVDESIRAADNAANAFDALASALY